MRIVNLKEFRDMPVGTIFMKYTPQYFGSLSCYQGKAFGVDFYYEDILEEIESNSSHEREDMLFEAEEDSKISLKIDFNYSGRDGMYNEAQLFAVYEKDDIEGLIQKLVKCRRIAYD